MVAGTFTVHAAVTVDVEIIYGLVENGAPRRTRDPDPGARSDPLSAGRLRSSVGKRVVS